ncbi:hypothetical protein ACIA6C_25595, partial [Streptomyces sp. NPDC051578]
MAGESPDKSVDEGASGTAEPATPRAERDPRLSVLRPREEAEPGDRDPLKEAVAAWVATEPSQGPADRAPARTPAEPEADSTAPAVPADRRPSTPGAAAPSDADGRDSAKASGSGEPEKTAFGVAKPGSGAGAGEASGSTAAEGKPAGEPRAAAEGERGSAAAEKPAPADSERTAVFRAV